MVKRVMVAKTSRAKEARKIHQLKSTLSDAFETMSYITYMHSFLCWVGLFLQIYYIYYIYIYIYIYAYVLYIHVYVYRYIDIYTYIYR